MPSQRKDRKPRANDKDLVVFRTLEKLASILLRIGLDAPRAELLLRSAFVLEAERNARKIGNRPTQSQIAYIAGVNRVDVRKVLASQHHIPKRSPSTLQSRVERVLTAWRQDPEFSNGRGRPRELSFVGPKNQFEKLVRKHGRDITVRTLRDDLVMNKIAVIKGTRLILSKRGMSSFVRSASALADLSFLYEHLARLELHKGRRTFLARDLALSASDLKLFKLAQQKAISKIETTLNSLESLTRVLTPKESSRRKPIHHLRITAIVSSDSDAADE
jgi:hypothetical protein